MDASKELDRSVEYDMKRLSKRRKLSLSKNDINLAQDSLFVQGSPDYRPSKRIAGADNCDDENTNISISATSKQAGRNVAPFLARHIPDQYAPAGSSDRAIGGARKDPNTKYCYRHRPDLKCRRQANEPSMDQLQQVGMTHPISANVRSHVSRGLEIFRKAISRP